MVNRSDWYIEVNCESNNKINMKKMMAIGATS